MSDKLIYMDNSATSPVDPRVLETMLPYFNEEFGNASTLYRLGVEAKKAVDKARKQVAELINADVDEITFTSGGSESDNMVIKGVALKEIQKATEDNPRNHIITTTIEHPAVLETCKFLEKFGFEVTYLPVDESGIITSSLPGKGIKLIHVSPSHHFPLGCVMSASRRASLLSWAEEENAWIAEDDYDSEFRFEGRPVPPIASYDHARVVYMNTFSRTLSPSIRIAYMVLPDELYEKYMEKFMYQSGSVSTLEQLTLASFISQGYYERHLNRVRNLYKKRKKAIFDIALTGALSKCFELEGDGSGMTFILKSKVETDEGFINYLSKQGLILKPLSEYCFNESDFAKNRYVVNFGSVTEEQFKKAAQVMCKALRVK